MLTTKKSQLQNAADAAAYSAALLQARDANFSAYTNRAMIANQVAVAQFVSLESYLEDAANTHRRANSALEDKGYRGLSTSAPRWDSAKRVPVDAAYRTLRGLAGPTITALDGLIAALDTAQHEHHRSTMVSMMLVADDVVKKNDPQAAVTRSAFMVGQGLVRVTNWGEHQSQRFRANDASPEADRFADAVTDRKSTDNFIRNRASLPNAGWTSRVKPYLCPLAVKTRTAFAFSHFGGTLLSSDKRRWLGLDATMGGGFVACTWLVPCPKGVCKVTVELPLPDIEVGGSGLRVGGSGGAQAGQGTGYGGMKNLRGYSNNPWESALYGGALISSAVVPAQVRYWSQGPGRSLDAAGGLQDHYRDVADPRTARPRNQTPQENGGRYPMTVEVEHTEDTLRLSSTLLPGAEQLRLPSASKGRTLRALASAHAYFYRPSSDDLRRFTRSGWQRGDHKTEYQNLFSPYWQARLAPTTAADELLSAELQ